MWKELAPANRTGLGGINALRWVRIVRVPPIRWHMVSQSYGSPTARAEFELKIP